jgi:hypothetical protein
MNPADHIIIYPDITHIPSSNLKRLGKTKNGFNRFSSFDFHIDRRRQH